MNNRNGQSISIDKKINFGIIETGNLLQAIQNPNIISTFKWLILINDDIEFRENFLSVLREDIECLLNATQGNPFIILGQTLFEELNHKKWNNYIEGYNSRFHFINNPNFKIPFLCTNSGVIKAIYKSGYNLNDIVIDSVQIRIPIVLDQFLMTYIPRRK